MTDDGPGGRLSMIIFSKPAHRSSCDDAQHCLVLCCVLHHVAAQVRRAVSNLGAYFA
jgi:hypothetical protein